MSKIPLVNEDGRRKKAVTGNAPPCNGTAARTRASVKPHRGFRFLLLTRLITLPRKRNSRIPCWSSTRRFSSCGIPTGRFWTAATPRCMRATKTYFRICAATRGKGGGGGGQGHHPRGGQT